jgi:ribosome-binding protein aMBF1 (putative translation factor)
MAGHAKWRDIRRQRETSPEYRAAYERAERAHVIGRRVRELREARGISQAELARRIGSSQSVIARLELGGAEPRFVLLERVAQALGAQLIVDLRPSDAQTPVGV